MSGFKRSHRHHLDSLPAYTPIEPFEVLSRRLGCETGAIIKLDANENPYGPSPKARQALSDLQFPHIYPDPESRKLRQSLADFTGLPLENLIAGAGADELIDLLIRLLIEPGDYVLTCPPTFGMYAFDTQMNAGKVVEVARQSNFQLAMRNIQEAVATFQPKILFLADPNNPDGSLLPKELTEELLKLPLLVVLDEAYIEFSDYGALGEQATFIHQVPRRDNLVVLRTFSKWAGLAGLRVGYGAFPNWLLPAIWKAKQPYNVNVAGSEAAVASLQDLDHHRQVIARIKAERQRLYDALRKIDWLEPYPSQANFILCKVTKIDAARLKASLASQYGILIRYFDKPGLKDHIRISVGLDEHTQALISALTQLY